MLQNQGWSEGEGLGTNNSGRSGNDARNDSTIKEQKPRKRSRLDRPSSSPSQEQPDSEATEEHILVGGSSDDDDLIVEVRKKAHVPTIDLTQSDTEEDGDEEDDDNDSPAPPVSTDNHPTGPTSTSTPITASDTGGTQTALLTPLPTILKSDRRRIGLKAKTEGPYRSSVKRVTHDAAALAAHLNAAEDMRRAQWELGKGRRAFVRAERIERERRQNMMAYLSEP